MKQPKAFLLHDIKDRCDGFGTRTRGGLRKLVGETRVLVYPMSYQTRRHHIEKLARRKLPIVLVHGHVHAEDHPRFNINRKPMSDYPAERHNEPMRVRVNGRKIVTLNMPEELGADYFIVAHTATSVTGSGEKRGPMQYCIRDARNGKRVVLSREFESLDDMRDDIVRDMHALNDKG